MIRRPPRSTQGVSSAASDVYKRQVHGLCAVLIISGIVSFILWDCFNDPSLRRLQSQCLIYVLIYDLVFHQLFYALILTILYSGLFGNPGPCYQDLAIYLIPQDAIQGLQDFYDEFAQHDL
eukprot:TRINITY_DN17118_c0_g1_i1.p1 TRINITY_DN17118_c0_g1~~TRINITY_DN17118_c0_g1_i1.p1  ORF type:complete len:121 (-),score=16.16 TRINITY_DN17118_c0_g1_i1:36-398(-)